MAIIPAGAEPPAELAALREPFAELVRRTESIVSIVIENLSSG